jgi:hypothetical protein
MADRNPKGEEWAADVQRAPKFSQAPTIASTFSGGEGEWETRQGIQRILTGRAFLPRPGAWHRHHYA